MSYNIEPRSGETISPTQVFDLQCAETRLKELTQLIIAKFVQKDLENFAMEYKKAFKPVPQYPLNEAEIKQKFYEKARKEAERILEQERRNVVEQRSEYIKNTLNIIIKQLRLLIYTENGKGKIYLKKVPLEGNVGSNSPPFRDILYFETYPEGIERCGQIMQQKSRIDEFSDYFQYMPQDLAALYQQASTLANVEFVGEKEKDAKT
jgi:hypothetical protein